MLIAPYSSRQDQHLWTVLSYPADVPAEFLEHYVAIITAFADDTTQQSQRIPPD